jgi:cephalosporin-C deacetylase
LKNSLLIKTLDFDVYWEVALKEQRATEPDIEMIKSSFQTSFAECFDLYFTGVRGARIHAQYLRPINSLAPHPAVLKFHGYSCNASDWTEKLVWVAPGFSVVAIKSGKLYK